MTQSDLPGSSAIDPKWNRRYAAGDTPWDMRIPSRELTRVLQARLIHGRTALEMGCGTGTNAVFLAEQQFAVTAVDGAPLAITQARQLAAERQVHVEWILADVCQLPDLHRTFDFVFDRGCYHCVRQTPLNGYRETLQRVTQAGSQFLVLTGNANETREGGPPRLREQELRAEFEPQFRIDDLRPFRFDDPDGPTGPLGWSCLLTRL